MTRVKLTFLKLKRNGFTVAEVKFERTLSSPTTSLFSIYLMMMIFILHFSFYRNRSRNKFEQNKNKPHSRRHSHPFIMFLFAHKS